MAAYTISRPAGNWDTKSGGRFFLSSFCRIVLEMVIPQV